MNSNALHLMQNAYEMSGKYKQSDNIIFRLHIGVNRQHNIPAMLICLPCNSWNIIIIITHDDVQSL